MRPKGSPKTSGSGRKKGTPNKTTIDVRARIEKLADPVGFWIKVAKGEKFTAGAPNNPLVQTDWYPTFDQIMTAQRWLLNKLVADLRSVEASTPDDKTLTIQIVQ